MRSAQGCYIKGAIPQDALYRGLRLILTTLFSVGLLMTVGRAWAQVNIDPGLTYGTNLETPAPAGAVRFAQGSLDGIFLFTFSSSDRSFHIWDFRNADQTTFTLKHPADIVAIAPLDGRKTVLALDAHGHLYEVDPKHPYPDNLGIDLDVKQIATTQGGGYALLANGDRIFIRPTSGMSLANADSQTVIDISGISGRLTAIAATNDRSEIVLGFDNGNVYLASTSGVGKASFNLGQSVAKLQYDANERRIVCIGRDGKLVVVDRRFISDDLTHGIVLTLQGIRSFDVSGLTATTGPDLVALDASGRIFTARFDSADLHVSEIRLAPSDDFGTLTPGQILIDYHVDTNAVERIAVFDSQSSIVRYYDIGTSPNAEVLPVAALTALRNKQWLAFDAANHFDGSDFTVESVRRALRWNSFDPQLNLKDLRLDARVRDCNLLKIIKTIRPAETGLGRTFCDRSSDVGAYVSAPVMSDGNRRLHFSISQDFMKDHPGITAADIQVFHQARLSKSQIKSGSCSGCFEATLEPTPGDNNVYVSIQMPEGTLASDVTSFDGGVVLKKPTLHLIMIGVSDYTARSGLPPLSATQDNALLEASIEAQNRINETYLIDQHDFNDADVSRAAIEHYFTQELKTSPDDRVWIAVAGHGITYGQPINDGSRFYLLMADAPQKLRESLLNGDLSQVISSEDIAGWLKNISARRIIISIDSCEAGGATDNIAQAIIDGFADSNRVSPLGAQIFVSATHNAKAMDGYTDANETFHASPAAQGLIDALEDADLKTKAVSVMDLFRRAEREVTQSQVQSTDLGTDSPLWDKRTQ